MSDDLSKKVLLSIQSDLDDVNASVESFKEKMQEAAQTLQTTKQAINEAKIAQANYSAELKKGQVDQQNLKTATAAYKLELMKANQAQKEAKQAVKAAAGSYDEAQQKLTALGRAIKSVEGGFKSNDPAIQKQIQDYRQLNNELKAFDSQMGNHQRDVGNYGKAIEGLTGQLDVLIPGYNQFSGILKSATGGFNALSGGAEEAESGLEGASGAALGLSAGLAAIVAVGAGVIAYFKDVATFSDGLSNSWAGVKASWVQLMNNLRDGKLDLFGDSLDEAAEKAKGLNQAMIDLKRNMIVSDVETQKEDEWIKTQMLKMRNIHTTAAEAEKIFTGIQAKAKEQYDRISDEAFTGFTTIADQIKLSANLTEEEWDQLMKRGIAAAVEFKQQGKHISDDLLDQFAQFQTRMNSAEELQNQIDQRAQNREEQRIAKDQAAQQKAEDEAKKEAADLLTAQEAFKKAQSDRTSSIMRTLEITQAAYGKELSQTQEHFRQLIFEQENFIDEQEKLKAKTKSQKVKDQANKNIGVARGNITQIGTERDTDIAEKMRVQAEVIFDLLQKSSNELANAEIANIQDVEQKQLAALTQRREAEKDAYEKERTDRQIEIDRLQADYAKAKGKQKGSLGRTISELEQIQRNAHAKELAEEQKYLDDKEDLIKEYNDKQVKLQDQTNVLIAEHNDRKGGSDNDKALLEAQQKELLDEYNAEVSNEKLTNDQKLLLEQQYLAASDKLNDDYRKKELEKAMQWEELAQNTATTILRNAIASNYEYTIANLERQKTYELQNQALTNTQKAAIDNKYRIEEGKAKQREFKQEQALKIGEAIMAGAKAVVEDLTQPWKIPFDIATTVAEIAEIAAQKPPAYAVGGIHIGDGPVFGPGTSTSDSINARLSDGESVINSKSTTAFGPLLSAINQWGGGVPFSSVSTGKSSFATGGVFNTYLPTSDNGLRSNQISSTMSVTTRMHPDDLNALANAILSAPAPIVDVKDINNQQGKLVNVQNRGSR